MKFAAAVVRSPMLSAARRLFYGRRVSIVYYHGVWKNESIGKALFGGIDLDTFRDDMRVLRHYFKPVSLSEALRFNAGSEKADEPIVAVTFDDGYDLTRGGVTDVLDELGIPATTFIVSACVDNRHLMWQHKFSAIRFLRGSDTFVEKFNRLAEKIVPGSSIRSADEQTDRTYLWPMARKDEYAAALWEACDMPPCEEFIDEHRPYVDWADLEDWSRRGHEVGLHTSSHPFCSRLTTAEIEEEIIEPARQLRGRLRVNSVPFAYPFGNRLPRAREGEVAELGRLSCLLGINGISVQGTPPYHLERARAEAGLSESVFVRPLVKAVQNG
jgi:peptidoglycan/xylan/chitin deacetylase (PgdA/CDA1 family)